MEQRYHKSQRLPNYDYSQNGCYFVTICTKGKQNILRQPVGAAICRPRCFPELSQWGRIVEQSIMQIPIKYPHIIVDKYVIMPNHVHILMSFSFPSDAVHVSLSTIIGNMKRWASMQIGTSIWQKGFYDHVIRDESDFQIKWHYIDTNPVRWESDKFYNTP